MASPIERRFKTVRQVCIQREPQATQGHPADTGDEEWKRIEPLLPAPAGTG
jgi:hypothetical protein